MRQGLLIFVLLVGLAPISHSEGNHGPFVELGSMPSGLLFLDTESILWPEVQHGPAIEPSGRLPLDAESIPWPEGQHGPFIEPSGNG